MTRGPSITDNVARMRLTISYVTLPVLILLLLILPTACALVEDVPPVADAGPDQSVKLGTPITLDASKSREIDGGTIVSYKWTVTGVPKGKEDWLNKVLITAADPKPTVQLPSDDGAAGVWTIEMRATDNGGNLAANEVHITLVK